MDCVQVDFLRFASAMHPLMSEYSEVRGEVIFKMFDIDCDGKINVLNLIQIHQNLVRQGLGKSLIAMEVRKLFREYRDKNILMKHGYK